MLLVIAPLLFIQDAFLHSHEPGIPGGDSTLVGEAAFSRPFFPSPSGVGGQRPGRQPSGVGAPPAARGKEPGPGRGPTAAAAPDPGAGAGGRRLRGLIALIKGAARQLQRILRHVVPRKNTVSSVVSNEGEKIHETENNDKSSASWQRRQRPGGTGRLFSRRGRTRSRGSRGMPRRPLSHGGSQSLGKVETTELPRPGNLG